MDDRARLLTAAMRFMQEHGIFIVGTTVASGITLGPEGALVGGLIGGAAASVGSLISSPWWRTITQLLITNLQLLYPFVRERMHVVHDLLNYIAELFVKLMRRLRMLPDSVVERPLMVSDRDPSDRDPPPPAH